MEGWAVIVFNYKLVIEIVNGNESFIFELVSLLIIFDMIPGLMFGVIYSV